MICMRSLWKLFFISFKEVSAPRNKKFLILRPLKLSKGPPFSTLDFLIVAWLAGFLLHDIKNLYYNGLRQFVDRQGKKLNLPLKTSIIIIYVTLMLAGGLCEDHKPSYRFYSKLYRWLLIKFYAIIINYILTPLIEIQIFEKQSCLEKFIFKANFKSLADF